MDREALEKMLLQGTDNALLRYTLGSLCLKQGDPGAAAEHLAQAVKLDQEHSASWKQYGKALAQLKRVEEARHAYQKGITVADARGDVQAAKEMRVFLKRLS
ncbi:MAG: tetratricopeptide repeat protein [Candidatus Thiodiazotropha sp. (ex Lucinoma kastoroae)]|nr:tetratricopeptide repeat protein [Candidatus Thiodiazotropha sp. (ex Lucinoma kastoroae)]MCU7858908.1 tetratricopeptide repeat protein [Candidatus Thiodiazotropha sp. (ex Lucinoma kastoroae)]